MADWFETRFREPVDAGRLDPAFAARVRAQVVQEWQAGEGQVPSDDFVTDDPQGEIIVLETEDRTTDDEPEPPRRRPPTLWLLAAAAVVLVTVIGGVLAAGDDDDVDTETAEPAPPPQPVPQDTEFSALAPGRYFIDPDEDETTPLRVTFDVVAEGWESWIGAVKFNNGGHTLLSIVDVENVVREGCVDHAPADPPVGPTVDDLATALSTLAPFELTSPPEDVTIQGYRGKHLQIRVPDIPASGQTFTECQGGQLQSWIASTSFETFYGYNAEPGRTEDFWILDVDGTRVMIETMQSAKSPAEDIAELEAMFESMRIEP